MWITKVLGIVAIGLVVLSCSDQVEPVNPASDVSDGSSSPDTVISDSATGEIIVDEGAPTTPQLVAVVATGAEELTLFWLPSTDDATPTEAIVYEVHRGASSNFTPGDATLLTEVVGAVPTVVTDLNRGESQFITLVARDADGSRSAPDDPLVISLPAADFTLRDGVNIVDLSPLGAPEIQDDTLTFQGLAEDEIPTVASGDFISGRLAEGLFLRRVLSATDGSGVLSVVTAAASPAEVIDSGNFSAQVRIATLPASMNPSTSEGREIRAIVLADGAFALRDSRPIGSEPYTARSFSFGSIPEDGVDWTGTLELAPTLGISVTMSPEMGIEETVANLTGALSLDTRAEITSSFSGLLNVQQTIYEQTTSLSYWLGPVPITQELTVLYRSVIEGTVNQPFDGTLELALDAELELNTLFDGIGWSASGRPTADYVFDPTLDSAGAVEAELLLVLDVATAIDSTLYLTTRAIPSLQIEMASSAVSDCPIDMELQTYDVDVSLALAAGPSIEAPVAPRLSLPTWSAVAFSLPELQIVGPENAFRPDGARFRYGGEDGVGASIDTSDLSWSVTPETALTVDGGVATVVPDVATAAPQAYVLALAGYTDTLGPGGVLCAPNHTFAANNRQATCQEKQVFILPGAETRFSVMCMDADRDYPLTVSVADGPFAGLLHDPIPQSISCEEDLCTVEFLFSVTNPPPALNDLMVLLPTDSMGLVGSLSGSFGNVQLGFNRAPTADPMTLIIDLDRSTLLSRDVVLEIDDPNVTGDPSPNVITTELFSEPILGTIEKLDELTYRYFIEKFTEDTFGSPLPEQNLFDHFEITATDAHGAESEPIEVTVILRPPVCDDVDLEPPGELADWSDYCVIEFCTAETCNVECLPLAALSNPLEANTSRFPVGTTCADKAVRWGTNWGGEPSDTTGEVVDVPCPCVGDREYADQVWLDFSAPAPYDTCTAWPFPWYSVCKAPPGWRE